jgi:hypothetical protein
MSALDNMTIVGWERSRSQPDARIENHGSIFLIRPFSPDAKEWLHTFVDPESHYLGNALAVESRYIAEIVAGMHEAGLDVQ